VQQRRFEAYQQVRRQLACIAHRALKKEPHGVFQVAADKALGHTRRL
jgi:hypothetical protein